MLATAAVLLRAAEPVARPRDLGGARVLDLAGFGDVAEWLRSGLQSRVHRFDSGRRLSWDDARPPPAGP